MLSLLLLAFVSVGAIVFVLLRGAHDSTGSPDGSSPVLVDPTTLAELATKQASAANLSHLDPAVMPPTNAWLSGMVLQATPQPVYPYPLSFLASNTGFELSLPKVTSNPTAILGEHSPAVQGQIAEASTFQLTRYDKVSATLSYRDAQGRILGKLTLAQGSPYVFYRAAADSSITLSKAALSNIKTSDQRYLRFTSAGQDYAVVGQAGSVVSQQGEIITIKIAKGSLVTFYALGHNQTDQLRSLAGNEVTGVSTTHAVRGSDQTTIFEFRTQNSKATVFAPLPYQVEATPGKQVASYDSIYGAMRASIGHTFQIKTASVASSGQLDLASLSVEQKAKLINSLQSDVEATVIDKQDSYFAGKQLARAANLLVLAEQLHQTTAAKQLIQRLNNAFGKRLGAEYFYYDSALKGVAANTKAFGSEDFNDHHFHYGYFIYAASILGKYDPSFVAEYADDISLLAADIASYQASPDFPVTRPYDAYAGHSWAAGLAPFADGNNQESSSEAIQAWNATMLWAQLTKNKPLEQTAGWMLANESATAAKTWRSVDTDATGLTSYTSPIVDINWGGKRTYATFFSDEPSAKLGIQLIPLNPAMKSFAADKATIDTSIAATIQHDNYNVPLGDYILMYLSLRDPQKAGQLIDKQQDGFIDDGNSRTYLMAWVFSRDR